MKVQPRPLVGVAALLLYLAAFYGVWIVNDVDYGTIGDSADHLLKWYVMPLVAGGIVLVVLATWWGWWRPALFESGPRAPRWTLIVPVVMAVVAVVLLLTKSYDDTTSTMLLYLVLGSIGVGFGEEMANRGMLLTGLRGGLSEPWVWFWSTSCFGLMHLPNWIFGAGPSAVAQVGLAFMGGTTFYLLRRGTGTLLWAMALHGLWDFSQFAGDGGLWAAFVIPVMGLTSLVLVWVLLRRERGVHLGVADARPQVVPAT